MMYGLLVTFAIRAHVLWDKSRRLLYFLTTIAIVSNDVPHSQSLNVIFRLHLFPELSRCFIKGRILF